MEVIKILQFENNKYNVVKTLNHENVVNSVFSADDLNVLFTVDYDGNKIWDFNNYHQIAFINDLYFMEKIL